MDILLQIVTDEYIMAFCAIMVGTIIYFWKVRHQQVNTIASIVTVLGVLGTFSGIAWGLLNFNPDNIEASVPTLLAGLKFAFITSILGILGSIVLKWLTLNKRKKQAALEVTNPGATVDDLAELLQNILNVEKEEGKETRKTLQSIENALIGDGDNTVMTRLQEILTVEKEEGKETRKTLQSVENALIGDSDNTVMTRLQEILTVENETRKETKETLQSIENALTDDGDNTVMIQLEKLLASFEEFATKMAEDNTPALIKALEEVMRDFNAKINEQFGDNFKQLNEAVGRINEWQEQYRQQMDELAKQFKVSAASIEKSRESLGIIANRSDAIVSSAEKLDPILEALQHQTQQLNDRLEAFKTLADDAHKAFPIITENLETLTNGFSTAVQETIANSHKSMEKQKTALANQGNQLETMVETTNGQLKKMTDDFSTAVQKAIDGSHKSMEAQKTALANLSKQLEDAMTESTNLMTRQIGVLDKALQEELTKSLKSLADQLISLSDKFVEDYTPLTNELRKVVQIASELK